MNVGREKKSYNRDKNRQNIAFLVSILVCLLVCIIGSSNAVMDLITLLCYFLVIFVIYLSAPELLLKYLHFWIMSSWAVLAVYVLENGNIDLRGNHSEHFGSLPIYVFSWIIFYLCICTMEMRKKKKKIETVDLLEKGQAEYVSNNVMRLAYVSFFLLLLCFLSICYKPYFALGVDRFVYKSSQLSGFVSTLSPWFYCLIPVVLMTRNRNKKLSVAYLTLLSLFCIWQGEKFSGLLRFIFYSMIAVSPEYAGVVIKKNLNKLVKIASIIMLLLLVIVIIQQIVLYQADLDILLNYFENRLAAQGELWWLTYKGDAAKGMHFNEIWDEISVWIHQPTGAMSDYNFGIYKLMKKFMNPNWVSYTLALGIRATEATRASLFYYGKWPALIIGQMLLGLLVYYTINSCTEYCNKHNWFFAILYLYILQGVISAAYMMDIQLLTTKRMILVYIILLISKNRTIKIGDRVIVSDS